MNAFGEANDEDSDACAARNASYVVLRARFMSTDTRQARNMSVYASKSSSAASVIARSVSSSAAANSWNTVETVSAITRFFSRSAAVAAVANASGVRRFAVVTPAPGSAALMRSTRSVLSRMRLPIASIASTAARWFAGMKPIDFARVTSVSA